MKLTPVPGEPWFRPLEAPDVPYADGNHYRFRTDDGELIWL